MKILILTPLFPPDTGAPAAYVKTLLQKLTGHTVTLILYGRLPESVLKVSMITIDKQSSKLLLILKSIHELIKNSRQADVLILNNGPSTELPAWLCSFFISTPMVLCISDPIAAKASARGLYSLIHKLCLKRVTRIVTLPANQDAYLRREILPFVTGGSTPEAKQSLWWENHVRNLIQYD